MTTATTFETNVLTLLKQIPDFSKGKISFHTLADFTEKAGFDINTMDAAIFAVGVLVATEEELPVVSEDMVQLGMREYGRAAVAGWRTASLTGFYEAVKSAIEDKLLPRNAAHVSLQSKTIGLMAFNFMSAIKTI